MEYIPTIGLEVHVHLKTQTKLFCGCTTEFGQPANTNICPICTGQPGVLPVLNRKAVELGIRTGIALNCTLAGHSIFARKNYFYPDLPKNYQISQYELPLASKGYLELAAQPLSKPNTEAKSLGLPGNDKIRVGVTRVHLEEDAGKLLHAIGSRELDYSLVDLNRTGIPLLEIVSEPEIHLPDVAVLYLMELKRILQYLNVSDCDMEKGSLRCDANVSVAPIETNSSSEDTKLGTKTELKNMNSFKAIHQALTFEIRRQIEEIDRGGKIVQETRLWDTELEVTRSMRSKEFAHDYRYFPEPDLVPLEITTELVNQVKETMVELPSVRKDRFIREYGLTDYDAGVLTADKNLADYFESITRGKNLADYFEKTVKYYKETGLESENLQFDLPKTVSNWITTELLGRLNAKNLSIEDSPVKPDQLAELIIQIRSNQVTGKTAKLVFEEMFNTGKTVLQIIDSKGLRQIADASEIDKIVDRVILENPKPVSEFQAGKEKAIGSLVGVVMKKTQGRANPQLVTELLRAKLKGT